MSTGLLIDLDQALSLAKLVNEEIAPLCKRIKTVGSVRRLQQRVRDIEMVVEPNFYEGDLFGSAVPEVEKIRAKLENIGEWVKGGDRMMCVKHLFGFRDQRLELYLCHPPSEWGSVLAIRTGPADLSRIAVTRIGAAGIRHENHTAFKGSVHIPMPEEEDFFRIADLPCWPPRFREQLALRLLGKEKITARTPAPTR